MWCLVTVYYYYFYTFCMYCFVYCDSSQMTVSSFVCDLIVCYVSQRHYVFSVVCLFVCERRFELYECSLVAFVITCIVVFVIFVFLNEKSVFLYYTETDVLCSIHTYLTYRTAAWLRKMAHWKLEIDSSPWALFRYFLLCILCSAWSYSEVSLSIPYLNERCVYI